jgi:hypothetical protein
MRVLAVFLAACAILGAAGAIDPSDGGDSKLSLLPIFAVMLAAGVFLFVHAQRRQRRDQRVALEGRLLALAQGSGILTVPHVVVALSLTSEEAKAALSQLSKDGLAEFDVDAEGAPIFRVRKFPPAG